MGGAVGGVVLLALALIVWKKTRGGSRGEEHGAKGYGSRKVRAARA